MTKIVKIIALGSLIASSYTYGASTAACAGCHGANFEKKAMGVSKVVKDMSKDDIVKALQGYKAGTYGGAMKGIMAGQAKPLSDADMASIADAIKGGGAKKADAKTETKGGEANKADAKTETKGSEANKADAKTETKVDTTKKTNTLIDINKGVQDNPDRVAKEDLGNKKVVTESTLGLRKDDLYKEDNKELPVKTDYSRPAPGNAPKFERAYLNAPPMIPHSVDGLLPITQKNNQCLGCHMPDVAKSMGATPIPPTHFTNYRPTTVYKNGELVKEGKTVGMYGELGNVGDIKIAKPKKLDHLYQGRFNCSQCHAPQAKVDTDVANTFTPDFKGQDKFKAHSTLADAMNEGVQ